MYAVVWSGSRIEVYLVFGVLKHRRLIYILIA